MNNQIDPENEQDIEGQNVKLANFLLTGQKWHCKLDVRHQLEIGYPNTRLSDLRLIYGLDDLIDRTERHVSKNRNGHKSICTVYYIKPENIALAKARLKDQHVKFYEKVAARAAI